MPMVRCDAGLHFYNSDQHTFCPYCRSANVGDAGVTGKPGQAAPKPVNHGANPGAAVGIQEGDGKTRRISPDGKADYDPVVGWLVCVGGPSRGKDYRIRGGQNMIGRSPKSRIQITGDDAISRDKQAVIKYDHKGSDFWFLDGEGSNNNYVNEELVLQPVKLKKRDLIQLGETTVLFVPLCGEDFSWGDEG